MANVGSEVLLDNLAGDTLAEAAVAHGNTLVEALPAGGESERGGGDESLDEEGGDEHG